MDKYGWKYAGWVHKKGELEKDFEECPLLPFEILKKFYKKKWLSRNIPFSGQPRS